MRIGAIRVDEGVRYGVIEADRIRLDPGASSALEVDLETVAPATDLTLGLLASPVQPVPRNVFCVGWNYVEHFAEGERARSSARELPDHPTFFTKATRTVVGPFDEIAPHPTVTETLDWEVELAVVIGREGRDISPDAALDHVFGYTVANDISARNVQQAHGGQWFRGKSLDATCPIGPWIVTRDEIYDIGSLGIRCRVNGETVQEARLGDMHFDVPTIVAELSRGLTLLAGDVILTGTPPGVGFARTPPRYLSPGDVVESEIDGIGRLRNVVGR